MIRKQILLCALFLSAVGSSVFAAEPTGKPPSIQSLLAKPLIDPKLPADEIREYTHGRILPMPDVKSAEEWDRIADQLRSDVLNRVIFRGEAAKWRAADRKVEWLETIEGGPGYHIKKLRFRALPGLWIPALLYVPDKLEGKVPVVMNVNGHASLGKALPYKQIRCINQAKRGMLALNVEWLGMGQLRGENYSHYRMNQLDLCGTSGLAPFYLAMERGLDVLLSLEHADPQRVAVAGLSGGGWQTIFISALDPRVTLANPVAGYSSFLTRTSRPSDLGDSEQAPVDMAMTADYLHLTAMRAPRPTLLTYNAKDNCCFQADYALPPLIDAAEPIFKLYGKQANLRSHVNHDPGTHNFDLDNRQQFYRMLGDYFYPQHADFDAKEIPSDSEVKSKEQLHVSIPADNAEFHSLAVGVMQSLPKQPRLPVRPCEISQWQTERRRLLAQTLRAKKLDVQAIAVGREAFAGGKAVFWRLRIDGRWTVPATELIPNDATDSSNASKPPTSTVLLIADAGRKSVAAEAERLLKHNYRVLAVDPFYFGESKIVGRDFLMAILLSSVGDRPLGLQAGQLTAIARWARTKDKPASVHLEAVGRRTSLIALAAAALDEQAVSSVTLYGSFGSLKEIIEQNLTVQQAPELFSFGLLEHFDIVQMAALVAPRPVIFAKQSERAQKELAGLKAFYQLHGKTFDPLRVKK